jgi:phosphohistidine swiveling domain-containing protein
MDRWITDTPASARFPIYTRGSADEVGPAPYSPLGWSLTWEQGICPGTADGWCSLGGFSAGEFSWPVPETFGNWGGYLYMARGRARVAVGLADLTDLEPGDIIVCSTTDPSWVPLFLVAGGVVCEVGAPSSHAAIVSREIGVPCVVSVTGARDRIADGTLVEIDGLAGTVRVLQGAAR